MYYLYKKDIFRKPEEYEYYTAKDFADVELKAFETIDELKEFWDNAEEDDHWRCVYDFCDFSTNPCKCMDEDDARDRILDAQNQALYEYYHNL